MISHTMNATTQQRLEEVFRFLDQDGNGFVSDEEVGYLMTLLGLETTQEERHELIAEVDPNHDGNLTFNEFIQVMSGHRQILYNKEDITRAFRMFADSSSPRGSISKQALKRALMIVCGEGGVEEEEVEYLIGAFAESLTGWVEYQRKIDFQIAD